MVWVTDDHMATVNTTIHNQNNEQQVAKSCIEFQSGVLVDKNQYKRNSILCMFKGMFAVCLSLGYTDGQRVG